MRHYLAPHARATMEGRALFRSKLFFENDGSFLAQDCRDANILVLAIFIVMLPCPVYPVGALWFIAVVPFVAGRALSPA